MLLSEIKPIPTIVGRFVRLNVIEYDFVGDIA